MKKVEVIRIIDEWVIEYRIRNIVPKQKRSSQVMKTDYILIKDIATLKKMIKNSKESLGR